MIYRTLLLLLPLLCLACSNPFGSDADGEGVGGGEGEGADGTTNIAPARPQNEMEDDSLRYTWVEDLNLRSAPNTRGKVLARLRSTDRLKLTGEKSVRPEAIVLRGKLYDEPWYEVRTQNDVKGWVFGGAIKRKGEEKGIPTISRTRFNFPFFGDYDLKNWEKKELPTDDAGDYAETKVRYTGDGQVLDITEGEGEYGYYIRHELKNRQGQPLKSRELLFDNLELLLSETITDHMEREPITYRRSESYDRPYQQMGGKVLILEGEFERVTLEQ